VVRALVAILLAFAAAPAGAQRAVPVPSYNLAAYTELYAGPKDSFAKVTLPSTLYLPQAAAGKVPAVIVMHGSAGVGGVERAVADRLVQDGIAALVVDWFTGRGITNTQGDQSQISFPSTAVDVLMAFKALAAMPEIDPARIGVVGYSRGATAQVMANSRNLAELWVGPGRSLAAFAMYYPACNRYQEPLKPMAGSVLILAGAGDTLTPPEPCKDYVAALGAAGVRAELAVYPDNAHAFDRLVGIRNSAGDQNSSRCPFRIGEDGVLTLPDGSKVSDGAGLQAYARRCVIRGATFGGTAQAADAAFAAFIAFVKTALAAR